MSLLDLLRPNRRKTAEAAKNRLQILLAHDRSGGGADFLPSLQRELLAVIRKYVQVAEDRVAVRLEREADMSVLEVNIELPGPRH